MTSTQEWQRLNNSVYCIHDRAQQIHIILASHTANALGRFRARPNSLHRGRPPQRPDPERVAARGHHRSLGPPGGRRALPRGRQRVVVLRQSRREDGVRHRARLGATPRRYPGLPRPRHSRGLTFRAVFVLDDRRLVDCPKLRVSDWALRQRRCAPTIPDMTGSQPSSHKWL